MHFADIDTLQGHRPTVVLLHSSGSNARQWSALAQVLQRRCDVITPDFFGHGQSASWPLARPLQLHDEVERIDARLQAAAGPVYLVGHSYGAAVALALALQRPLAYAGLALYEPVLFHLLDSAGDAVVRAEVIQVADSMRHAIEQLRPDVAAARFVDYWSGAGTWDTMPPARQQGVALRMPAAVAHFDALFGVRAEHRIDAGSLAGLRLPALMMTGRDSRPVALRVADRVMNALPEAQHRCLEGADHMAPITQSARINALIEGFLVGLHWRTMPQAA
jgi:pimeloyl-ACP methyl ester carboxylesterase